MDVVKQESYCKDESKQKDANDKNEYLNSQDNPPPDNSFADHVFANIVAGGLSLFNNLLRPADHILMVRLQVCSEGRTTLMELLLRSNTPCCLA
jgi:hypothetical protein